jgi:Fusaric acid resistance protein family
MADPVRPRRACEVAVRTLTTLPAGTPSLRLLADQTARVLAGISDALNGLALLVGAPVWSVPRRRGVQLRVPDWLPSLVNAGRAFVAIGIVELFWIMTEWPNGAFAITFTAITVLLLAPQADRAYVAGGRSGARQWGVPRRARCEGSDRPHPRLQSPRPEDGSRAFGSAALPPSLRSPSMTSS